MARQLASIKTIQEIRSIDGADAICQYRVDGWWIVDRIGQYNVGDKVVYIEIDSFLRDGVPAWQFLVDKQSRMYNDVKGHVLKTIRLRKALSQGLILPISSIASYFGISSYYDGMDVTETLGIEKYEPPIPAQLAGLIRGNFPSFVPKTDQTRIQSLGRNLESWIEDGLMFVVEEKLDGSSCSVIIKDGDIQVCSRNLSLKEDDNNTFWKVAKEQGLIEKLVDIHEKTGYNIALQGELVGPGIQGNPYKLNQPKFFLFDIYDIDGQHYWPADLRYRFVQDYKIEHVPIINPAFKLTSDTTIDSLLEMAEGKSVICKTTEREGLVFKCLTDPSISFKAISNKFLLKNKN